MEEANNITTESKEISKDDILNFIHDHKIAINNDNITFQDSTLDNSKQEVIVNLSEDAQQVLFDNTKSDSFEDDDIRYVIPNNSQRHFLCLNKNIILKPEDVTVTSEEKDLFLRAILLSKPFKLTLRNENKLSLEIQNPDINIVQQIELAIFIHELSEIETGFLYLSFMLQAYNGKPLEFKNSLDDPKTRLDEINKWLSSKIEAEADFIYEALDVFECKVFKLSEVFSSENF